MGKFIASPYQAENKQVPQVQGGAPAGPLGTTYEIVSPESGVKSSKALESLKERFEMQDIFRRILNDRKFGKNKKTPRINFCMRYPVQGSTVVDLVHQEGRPHGSYRNLQVCGSASGCPICAGKISRGRADEINKACDLWLACTYGTFLMVSLTIPHYRYQSLHEVRERFMAARRNLKRQKSMKGKPEILGWDQFCTKYGIRHMIYAADFTWSARNGHHVHSHDLWFVQNKLTDEQIADLNRDLTAMWVYQCEKKSVGVVRNEKQALDMIRHSVDVQEAKTAAEYIAKFGEDTFEKNREALIGSWSAVDEVTQNHIKRGSADRLGDFHFTPWDFARVIKKYPMLYEKYGALLREYVDEMRGRRMISWSKGSKEFFTLPEVEDEDLVTLDDAEAELVYRLHKEEFKVVRDQGKRAELAILAAHRDPIKIQKYIEELRNGQAKIRGQKKGSHHGIEEGTPPGSAGRNYIQRIWGTGGYNEGSISRKKETEVINATDSQGAGVERTGHSEKDKSRGTLPGAGGVDHGRGAASPGGEHGHTEKHPVTGGEACGNPGLCGDQKRHRWENLCLFEGSVNGNLHKCSETY